MKKSDVTKRVREKIRQLNVLATNFVLSKSYTGATAARAPITNKQSSPYYLFFFIFLWQEKKWKVASLTRRGAKIY